MTIIEPSFYIIRHQKVLVNPKTFLLVADLFVINVTHTYQKHFAMIDRKMVSQDEITRIKENVEPMGERLELSPRNH